MAEPDRCGHGQGIGRGEVKFYFAKLLQLIGITTVGFGLMYGLTNAEGLRFELRMLMVGSGAFLVGRLIEGRGAA